MRRLQVDLCLSTDEAIGTVLANAVPETTDVLLHVEVDQALLLRVVEGNALVVEIEEKTVGDRVLLVLCQYQSLEEGG